MNVNWRYFIQAIEEEGVPNFTPDGKEIWNVLDDTLIRLFQHKYTTLTHTDKIKLKQEIFKLCFKTLFSSPTINDVAVSK